MFTGRPKLLVCEADHSNRCLPQCMVLHALHAVHAAVILGCWRSASHVDSSLIERPTSQDIIRSPIGPPQGKLETHHFVVLFCLRQLHGRHLIGSEAYDVASPQRLLLTPQYSATSYGLFVEEGDAGGEAASGAGIWLRGISFRVRANYQRC